MNPFGANTTKAATTAAATAWATMENPMRSQNAWTAFGPVTGY